MVSALSTALPLASLHPGVCLLGASFVTPHSNFGGIKKEEFFSFILIIYLSLLCIAAWKVNVGCLSVWHIAYGGTSVTI
jgi:hypothetical protein